jgi:taurine dioxygenase
MNIDFVVNPLSDVLGAEVIGLDMRQPLNEGMMNLLLDTFYEHQVLVFRNQDLTAEEQIAACSQFGEVERHPLTTNTCKYPEITYVSNVTENGKALGYTGPEFELWHSDMCYYPNVIKMAFLYAQEVPEKNGNTLFSDMYKAYDELDTDIKSLVEGKYAVFGSGHNLMSRCRERGYDITISDEDIKPDVIHPVIHTHPITLRKAILVNWTHTDHILDIPKSQSDEVLKAIYEHCSQRKYIYSHDYRPNDLIVWDNFSLLHTGSGKKIEGRRVMRRVAICGPKPYYA